MIKITTEIISNKIKVIGARNSGFSINKQKLAYELNTPLFKP